MGEASDTVLWTSGTVRSFRTKCGRENPALQAEELGETLAVARGRKIAHTVSIETIEYEQMRASHGPHDRKSRWIEKPQ